MGVILGLAAFVVAMWVPGYLLCWAGEASEAHEQDKRIREAKAARLWREI